VKANTIQHSDDAVAKSAFVSSMPGSMISGSQTADFEVSRINQLFVSISTWLNLLALSSGNGVLRIPGIRLRVGQSCCCAQVPYFESINCRHMRIMHH
jgi:hypothetical protein